LWKPVTIPLSPFMGLRGIDAGVQRNHIPLVGVWVQSPHIDSSKVPTNPNFSEVNYEKATFDTISKVASYTSYDDLPHGCVFIAKKKAQS
ncbi:MAG: hypothetical protein IJC75_05170, partial [Oscillospiraceae bacterium]|nr:hypothetical protein [Oscillospiraceae bacterium]